jgi:hypothetical protein
MALHILWMALLKAWEIFAYTPSVGCLLRNVAVPSAKTRSLVGCQIQYKRNQHEQIFLLNHTLDKILPQNLI